MNYVDLVLSGGLFSGEMRLGWKAGRLVVGGALGLTYLYGKQAGFMSNELEDHHQVGLSIGPVVEYLVAEVGHAGFHLAVSPQFLFAFDDRADERNVKRYGFQFDIGVGMRYYFSGRIGLGLQTGLCVSYMVDFIEDWPEDVERPKMAALWPYAALSVATIW